jgi:hypothetical protein
VTTTLQEPPEQPAPQAPALSRPPLDPVHAAVVAERKGDFGVGRPSKRPTRDALVALQYTKLAGLQPHVFARIEKALLDEKDPLHELVVDKLIQRVVPTDFWSKLATQEFATDEKNNAPSVTIVIGNQAGMPVTVVSEQ